MQKLSWAQENDITAEKTDVKDAFLFLCLAPSDLPNTRMSVGRMVWLFSTVTVLQLVSVTVLQLPSGAVNPTEMETGVTSQSTCPDGWHQNGHRCFSFYPVWATWVSAESYCSQSGGNLASIHSPDQQVFIQDLVKRHTNQPVWIGGYDITQKGVWLWSDGSVFYNFHGEEEPIISGHGKNCMELHTGGGRGWNDASCEELRFYVCSMKTRSNVDLLQSQKNIPQTGLVEGASLYDVMWTASERVADETLHYASAFLSRMYAGHLPVLRYTEFCHQEALYLNRSISMLEELIRTLEGPEDIKQFLQRTHQHYELTLKNVELKLLLLIKPPGGVGRKDMPGTIERSLIEKYQDVMDINKAVNIFRVNMINEKALFTSSWFPTGYEEEVEDQTSFLLSVESGPDLNVRL
ncbi:hypothetical protein DPEC_G00106060 [Dallia pectoralis]|uniref:Uncharacterized protein n=1 Tax=Dallia pectoralis TaxID=75939 RepID=A0ACC2GYE6_DALPE|nr:hypothetical protein DPEC_G00106060 [Dallia pectoralis]